jgi:hypothetical protein
MRKSLWLIALILIATTLIAARYISISVPMTLGEAISLGQVGSAVFSVNKFGAASEVDQTEESVSDAGDLPSAGAGPDRCFANMATAAALYISSDDATDAGLGVTVEALDENWATTTIAATLGADTGATGTEFVQIGSADLLRINRAYATSAALTGNIYMHKDSVDIAAKDGIPDTPSTDIVAVITAGENQTLQACYTVPASHRAILKQWCVSDENTAANATGEFRITLAEAEYRCTPHDPPLAFGEKTDIEITADMSANDGAATGTFDLVVAPTTMR